MDYIIILALQLIGVGFHVMQKVGGIKDKYPELTMNSIWRTFFREDWNTLIISVLVLALAEIGHFIIVYKKVVLTGWTAQWWFTPGLSLLLGYAGQRLIYKYLGTAEKAAASKAENLPGASKSVFTEKVETPTETVTKTTIEQVKPKTDGESN